MLSHSTCMMTFSPKDAHIASAHVACASILQNESVFCVDAELVIAAAKPTWCRGAVARLCVIAACKLQTCAEAEFNGSNTQASYKSCNCTCLLTLQHDLRRASSHCGNPSGQVSP